MACSKRQYTSVEVAMKAHHVSWRIRTYRCPECHLVHVSNADKNPGKPESYRRAFRGRGRTRPMPGALAPELSFADVEAIAAQKRRLIVPFQEDRTWKS